MRFMYHWSMANTQVSPFHHKWEINTLSLHRCLNIYWSWF